MIREYYLIVSNARAPRVVKRRPFGKQIAPDEIVYPLNITVSDDLGKIARKSPICANAPSLTVAIGPGVTYEAPT